MIERVDASVDEVALRNGSFVRGTLVELARGSHVTITVDDEPRRIAWAEIERVRQATAPTPAPAVTKTPPHKDPPSQTEPASGTQVYIDSTNGRRVTLYRISGEFVRMLGDGGSIAGITYEPVCSGTCGQHVDGTRGYQYFVGGERIKPSRRFTLDDAGPVTLEVKAGSRAAWISGLVLLSLGTSLLVPGLLALPHPEVRRMAVGLTVMGCVGLAAGIPLAIIGRTIVKRRQGR